MSLGNNYSCEGQMSLFDPDTWCGRMCLVPSQVTKEPTSKPFLKKQPKWQKGMPAYLDLRAESGPAQDASWEMGGALLGDYTMRSFGECPSAENVSLLSQILEATPHPKYSLSARACQGILNRANRRGKKLPEVLEKALIRQATPLKSEGGVEVDSKGKKAGKGALVQTELSGTLGVSQDQTLIQTISECAGFKGGQSSGGIGYQEECSPTLQADPSALEPTVYCLQGIGDNVGNTLGARDYKQPQAVVYGLCSDGSNAMKSSNPHSGIYEAETTRTLDNNGGNPACNQGGMMVVQGFDGYNQQSTGDVAMPLRSKNADSDHIPCVYGIDRASFNQGQNAQYDFSVTEEQAQTLVSRGPGGY